MFLRLPEILYPGEDVPDRKNYLGKTKIQKIFIQGKYNKILSDILMKLTQSGA
jgi:hypothetical protein